MLSIKLVTTLGSVFHCNVCWVCEQIIANNSDEQQRSFGRHFDMEDELVSRISRRSIDILKQNYRASPIFLPCFSSVPDIWLISLVADFMYFYL